MKGRRGVGRRNNGGGGGDEDEEVKEVGESIMKWQSQNLFIALLMNDKIFIIVF